MTKPILKY